MPSLLDSVLNATSADAPAVSGAHDGEDPPAGLADSRLPGGEPPTSTVGRLGNHIGSRVLFVVAGAALLLPAAHPLLIPLVGVPSHLLWLVHVLPIALVAFRFGKVGAMAGIPLSALLVLAGERAFGAGYGVAADWHTVGSLTLATTLSNLLVVSFALYARQEGRTYRILFERAGIGIVRTDADWRIVDINPTAGALLGWSLEMVRGRYLEQMIGVPEGVTRASFERFGGWFGSVESTLGPISRRLHLGIAALAQDDPPGQQVLLIDRTIEAAQERELARATQLAYLGESLANVAHELRNPLMTIAGFSELGGLGDDDEEIREYFLEINRAGRRMSALIDDLLGLARPATTGSTPLHLLLHRMTALHQVLYGSRISFEERIEFQGNVAVPGDRIEQIIGNLISNAVDAIGPEGGAVLLTCRQEGTSVQVRVADDGPGIPPEILPRLFESFATSKLNGDGNGLGLAIARRLAKGYGGDLTGTNREAGGAEFVLTLPIAETRTDADSALATASTVGQGNQVPMEG